MIIMVKKKGQTKKIHFKKYVQNLLMEDNEELEKTNCVSNV